MSASLRRFWRTETGIFLGIWLGLMVIGRSRLLDDPGMFWHTVTGRTIVSTGRFLDNDPYSFTFGGQPWIPYEWLAECAMAAVHDGIGGLDSLLVVTITALAALYTWAAHRLLRAGLHGLPTTLLIAMAIAVGAGHFLVRPHIATLVFLGVTFAWLCDVEAGRAGLNRLFWLVPLFVLWVNWHGGVLGGLATLGLTAAGWLVPAALGRESPVAGSRQALVLGAVVLACALSILVNPYGLSLPRTWIRIMGSPVLPRLIIEHAPPDPRSAGFALFGLLLAVYGLTLAGTLPQRPRFTWIIPATWAALALTRVRHASLFGVTAVFALAEILPYSRLAHWLARPGREWFQFRSPPRDTERLFHWRPMVLPSCIVATAILLQMAGVAAPIVGRGWAKLDPSTWPVELLPDLRQCEREGSEGARIFNDLRFGGFLIHCTPGLKVFIDDRCELYGDRWLVDFAEAQDHHPERIESWARQYGIHYALVQAGSNFDRYLEKARGWVLVRRVAAAALYKQSNLRSADGKGPVGSARS